MLYDDQEIAAEAERIRAGALGHGGAADLYEALPLFAHPDRLLTPQAWEWWDSWRACRATGTPLARCLDEAPAHTVAAFELLDRETRAAAMWRASHERGA